MSLENITEGQQRTSCAVWRFYDSTTGLVRQANFPAGDFVYAESRGFRTYVTILSADAVPQLSFRCEAVLDEFGDKLSVTFVDADLSDIQASEFPELRAAGLSDPQAWLIVERPLESTMFEVRSFHGTAHRLVKALLNQYIDPPESMGVRDNIVRRLCQAIKNASLLQMYIAPDIIYSPDWPLMIAVRNTHLTVSDLNKHLTAMLRYEYKRHTCGDRFLRALFPNNQTWITDERPNSKR